MYNYQKKKIVDFSQGLGPICTFILVSSIVSGISPQILSESGYFLSFISAIIAQQACISRAFLQLIDVTFREDNHFSSANMQSILQQYEQQTCPLTNFLTSTGIPQRTHMQGDSKVTSTDERKYVTFTCLDLFTSLRITPSRHPFYLCPFIWQFNKNKSYQFIKIPFGNIQNLSYLLWLYLTIMNTATMNMDRYRHLYSSIQSLGHMSQRSQLAYMLDPFQEPPY